ncbi:COG3178: Predicted phosphotransferase related to Ser/Thr protein kinases [hydrothermal vent metagenome]|uniref:COG3178: Predicted phosphotransferase related to Ser/Thr protein kinases n=1 Tax=hydrothermal vent metagenome TaxID=652676 RepID=A0A1W1BEJ6_9ZZZZ
MIREQQLKEWLDKTFEQDYSLSKIADDASFRRYFRLHLENNSFVVMDAPPQKENIIPFIKIAQFLSKNNISSPKIYQSDLSQGFLILEDFGNKTMAKEPTFKNYKKAINELIKLQKINNKNLPKYTQTLFINEMLLFIDWYLPFYKRKILTYTQKITLKKLFFNLAQTLIQQPQVFVHRDYHCRNIMIKNDKSLGIIDFQDAVIGGYTYDLVSLLKDAYHQIKPKDYQDLLTYFYNNSHIKLSLKKIEYDVDLMGVQRHIKILGIFTRLAIRDKKNQYLNNIPLIESYLKNTMIKYPELAILRELL